MWEENYDYIHSIVVDLYLRTDIHRWDLGGCGDGALNFTSVEQCDISAGVGSTFDGSYTDSAYITFTDALGTTQDVVYKDEKYYTCNSICQLVEYTDTCGDGVGVDFGVEACDDGNADDDDGCTDCTIDSGYYCDPAPADTSASVCDAFCGDGIINNDPIEECDLGDYNSDTTDATDGITMSTPCKADCTFHDDY